MISHSADETAAQMVAQDAHSIEVRQDSNKNERQQTLQSRILRVRAEGSVSSDLRFGQYPVMAAQSLMADACYDCEGRPTR